MRTIIYGPPGTGKTHTLLQHIEKFLETTDPDKIGYFTFSKNAAVEGKERAALKFRLSLLDDLPYFQTLHSFCFNQLGLSKDQVMKEKHYRELGEKMGLEIEGTQQDEDHDSVFYSKNPYIQLINIARSKEIDPVKYYHLTDNPQVSLNKLKIISEELQRYKTEHGLVDFPDMIEKFLHSGDTPKLRVMFVDALANKIINKVKNRVDKKYYPKEKEGSVKRCQSLHEVDFTKGKWLVLATANYMLSDIGDVLDEKGLYWQRRKATPRVKNIYEIIQKWNELKTGVPMHFNDCKKIFNKMNKNWDKKLFKAMVKDQFYGIDDLKQKYGLQTEADWQEALDELGNEDIRKITKLIKTGEDLSSTPRISISTIHGVKGNERENVVINTELSGAAYDEYQKNPDDTHRLFYVACTRTENNLFIIEPQRKKAYDI
jgi:superfamily I DNA/RNA helicase